MKIRCSVDSIMVHKADRKVGKLIGICFWAGGLEVLAAPVGGAGRTALIVGCQVVSSENRMGIQDTRCVGNHW